jgi:glutaredoxin 3
MEIVAYTNQSCSHCMTLKKLFKRANVSYTEISINRDITVSEFRQQFPTATGYPYVIINGEVIGGLVETAKLFLDKGLVEAPKL